MADAHDTPAGAVLEAAYLRDALGREFRGLISQGDIGFAPEYREQAFLMRALAAKAVRIVTGATSKAAAAAVTDGYDDLGIDAVEVDPATGDLWLVLAKWSDQGTAQCTAEGAAKLVHGLRMLDNREFEHFNARLQHLADVLYKVLDSPSARIHLVVALMGSGPLDLAARHTLEEACDDFFGAVDFRVLTSADFQAAVQQDDAGAVEITAAMTDGWSFIDFPYRSYYGTVPAADVAQWYEELGPAWAGNNPTDQRLSERLAQTLTDSPETFWYLTNGITVVCEQADARFIGSPLAGRPMHLRISRPQVANGVQTLGALYRVLRTAPQALDDARLLVRVVVAPDAGPLAQQMHQISPVRAVSADRDAAGAVQELIREDFQVSLGLAYVVHPDQVAPAPEVGCHALEAAAALASAHPDPRLAVRAADPSGQLLLSDPVHQQLFGRRPAALQIWRTVLYVRAVAARVHEHAQLLDGRRFAIASGSAYLLAHVLLQRLEPEVLQDPDADWDEVQSEVQVLAGVALAYLIDALDTEFGPNSSVAGTLRNPERCARLAQVLAVRLQEEGTTPDPATLPLVRVRRRASAVRLLIERHALPDGTQLVFQPSRREEQAIGAWLDEDPNRFLATWVNDPKRPLVWAADGQSYSPSGLVTHMWREANWQASPLAVQGTRYWALPDGATLEELAQPRQAGGENGAAGV